MKIFMGTAGAYGVVDAVNGWVSEKQFYHRAPITRENVKQVGHYTQVVWKGTDQVGCGKAVVNGKIIIVCNYNPAGNFLGQRPY